MSVEAAHNARMPTPEPARHDDDRRREEERPRRVAGTVRLMTEDPFEIDDDAEAGIGQRHLLDRGQEPVDHPRRAGGDRRGFPRAAPPALTSSPPRGASATSGGLLDPAKISSMQRLESEAGLRIHRDRLGGLEDARQDLDDPGEVEVLRPRLERRAVGLPDARAPGRPRRSRRHRGRMTPRRRA